MGDHRRPLSLLVTVLASVFLLGFVLVAVVGADTSGNGEPPQAEAVTAPTQAPDGEESVREGAIAGPPERVPPEGAEAAVPSAVSTTNYLNVSASGFTPLYSDMTYAYGGNGCMYRTGGGSSTEYAVQLPKGAVVDQLYLTYVDDDPVNNARAYLYSFDGLGNNTTISTVVSYMDVDEYLVVVSTPFSHTVDSEYESLALRLDYGDSTDRTLRICSVRLRYQYSPLWATFLPSVER